jgi:hypothetical protein
VKLDVDLVRQQLAKDPVRARIAADYGVEDPSARPDEFASEVIGRFEQPVVKDALDQEPSNTDVFRAAVLAIASSNARWSAFLKEKDSLTALLCDYDPVEVNARLRSGELTPDGVANHLKSPYRAKDAARIAAWAALLAVTPTYYEAIRDVGTALRAVGGADSLPDEKLMLCLVGYFTDPTSRWPGEDRLTSWLRNVRPVAGRKFLGMGRPLASEFLRNLGWDGYKPDRHVLRLFRDWTGGDPPEHLEHEARWMCSLIGRKGKDVVADTQSALLRIELTPEGISYLEADNLIWLLGAYVETLDKRAPRLRYVID